MRLVLAAFTAGLLLAGGSAAAAPQFAAPPHATAIAAPLHLVRGGCGIGFHRYRWRGRYGHWHVRCVPNR